MKTAKISELKDNLSRLLAYVRRGGTVRVYDRDTPIADLSPCRIETGGDGEALLADLERTGVVRRGRKKLPKDFLSRRLPKPRASVLASLLDERREDR